MSETANLGLPLLAAAQAQKHVTVNEALRRLDAIVQLAVLDRTRTAPPATPLEGSRHIVAASATGAWAGHGGDIAAWGDGAWDFIDAAPGFVAFVVAEARLVHWTGSDWSEITAATALQNLTALGIGTAADSGNPLAAKLNSALFTAKPASEAGNGDLRFTLNKSTAGDSVSQLYQTNYSGRAETGLTGDDDFRIKVSPDGSTWRDALVIDRATGGVRFLVGEVSLAAAATCAIGGAAALRVAITGSAAIASFGSSANALRFLRFTGAATLTFNAASMVLPGGADIVAAAGDTAIAVSDSAGNWRVVAYQRASGVGLLFRGAKLVRTADQSIANAMPTAVIWTAETVDTDAFHSTATNPARITIPAGVGHVRLSCAVRWEANATGARYVALVRNGTSTLAADRRSASSESEATISCTAEVSAGDYIEVVVTQSCGGVLALRYDAPTHVSMQVLG